MRFLLQLVECLHVDIISDTKVSLFVNLEFLNKQMSKNTYIIKEKQTLG